MIFVYYGRDHVRLYVGIQVVHLEVRLIARGCVFLCIFGAQTTVG